MCGKCISITEVPLHVPPKVSNHFAVVEYMKEARSLITQRAGSIVLPQLQIDIMWKGVMCSIKGNLYGVSW